MHICLCVKDSGESKKFCFLLEIGYSIIDPCLLNCSENEGLQVELKLNLKHSEFPCLNAIGMKV